MKLLYARFNKHRLPHFQIGTYLAREQNKLIVIKEALTNDALLYIEKINAGYLLLAETLNSNVLKLPVLLHKDKKSIQFEYINGKSLEELMFLAFLDDNKTAFLAALDNYLFILKSAFKIHQTPVFSGELCAALNLQPDDKVWTMPLQSISPATLDIIPDNILRSEDKYFFIDTEWVFEGAIPLNFLIYRTLYYFYEIKYSDFECNKWLPLTELWNRYGVLNEEIHLYKKLDDGFQRYVFGEPRFFKYKNKYEKGIHTIETYEARIAHYKAIADERGAFINEVVNSRGWKIIRKAEKILNTICPKHSIRRYIVEKLVSFLSS